MPFRMLTRVSPKNHVLARGPDPHMWRGNFDGKKGPAEDMTGSWYTQSNSAEDSTGTMQMLIGVY